MPSNFDNFDNMESSFRKSSVIQERVNLVSSHMYKQFLDYQNANINTAQLFLEMIENLQAVVTSLKQSFAARGIATQNIYLETDSQKTIAVMNILWHQFSFTTRCNYEPQALFRGETNPPVFSGRIMAIKGNYNDLMKNVKDHDEEMKNLLEYEVASLFVPAEKNQNTFMKIRHLSNKEFYMNQLDAPREFVLKVVETICGGGLYHKEGTIKSFTI